MKHLGDIMEISGFSAPSVEVIIGGSPCQDLSVAGKRAGLSGERSGLFMEQIRIIKEMRERDIRAGRTNELIRPRFMVWENVPGAFSSNKGEDFRIVLEETVRVVDETAVVPRPPKGKWTNAGAIVGDGWSLAWRIHDAQFWGVPQRRRRIALVADFGGQSAPEILFERESVSGDSTEGGATWERAAADTEKGVDSARPKGNREPLAFHLTQDPISSKIAPCLSRGNPVSGQCSVGIVCMATQQGGAEIRTDDKAPTLTAAAGMSGNNQPVVCYDARGNGDGTIAPALTGDHENRVTDYTAVVAYAIGNGQADNTGLHEKAGALNCMHDQQAVILKEKVENFIHWIVRRLTPLECERLQGFPDGWTDIGEWMDGKGKKHRTSDASRYKALGNSIALPFWMWMLNRLSAYCTEKTMASLFDGIGGFPLICERLSGKGSCLWASEIDEFCIAVTKKHFKEDNNGK